MARIRQSNDGKTPFQKLLGHNRNVMEAWAGLGDVLEQDGLLPAELKEQMRRTLAQGNHCEYCKVKGRPDPSQFDARTSVAAAFAEVFLKYPRGNVPEAVFQVLREHFNEEEISELSAFICFTSAQQAFGAMMALKPDEG